MNTPPTSTELQCVKLFKKDYQMKMLSVCKKGGYWLQSRFELPTIDNSQSIASSKGTPLIGNCNLRLKSEVKPSCVYSISKPHSQSFRSPVRPLLSKAKPSCVYSILKPQWSEFQKPTQTTAKRGEAELHILDFKTTWSEFKKPS